MDRQKLARLVRVLGLLGSDSVGERASAGLAADRLRGELGASWADLLMPPGGTPHRRSSYDVDERAAAEARMRQLKAPMSGWSDRCGYCAAACRPRRRSVGARRWEMSFDLPPLSTMSFPCLNGTTSFPRRRESSFSQRAVFAAKTGFPPSPE